MSDPLTALMHAVQVMNFLKTLILRTLRERDDAATTGEYTPYSSPASSSKHDDAECCFDSEQEVDDHLSEVEEGFLRRLERDLGADRPEVSCRKISEIMALEDAEPKAETMVFIQHLG